MSLLKSVFAVGILAGAAQAQAAESINCYEMETPIPPSSEMQHISPDTETWCYWYPEDTEGKVLFSIEDQTVRPELSALVKENGDITFGSMLKGQVASFTVNDLDSPFNAPLEEPKDMKPLENVLTDEIMDGARKVLTEFKKAPKIFLPTTLRPGRHQASVARSALPWRGYWFPFNTRTMVGPMSRYDQFVAGRTGRNPGAANWELRHHGSGDNWHGHCNGWAAASVLRPEPTHARRDPQTGVVFSISDQKGIWIEDDNCIRANFVGRRNDGGRAYIFDIHPALFHKTLTRYIGGMGKPILMDYDRSAVVFHNVISGYDMTIRPRGRELHVRMMVTSHQFDDGVSEAVGVAKVVHRRYDYILYMDDRGRVASGKWLSPNPDFLWIPQSPAECSPTNSALETRWVKEIMSLPAY